MIKHQFTFKNKYYLCGIFSALIYIFSAASFAADYYVDINNPGASDQNSGTESSPWRTLQKINQANLSPGDTVFVKSGVYNVNSGGTWEVAVIRPSNSGAPGNPITIKSIPKHGAIIDGGISMGERNSDDTQALIGTGGKSYITIDGFVVRNAYAKGIGAMSGNIASPSKGNIIQNNIVTGVFSGSGDNTDGIRMENQSEAIVRNNYIYNIRNGLMSENAACIKMYGASNSVVENNECKEAATGIYDKSRGRNNIIRRNYVHNTSYAGIRHSSNSSNPAGGNHFYENVISNPGNHAFDVGNTGGFDDEVYIYNNVFSNYRTSGVRAGDKGDPVRLNIYNNIFHRVNGVSNGEILSYDDPPVTVLNSNYNVFTSSPVFMIGLYMTDRALSLSEWNSVTGFDIDSIQGEVNFIDAANDNFRVSTGSIAEGAGRVGGVPSGSIINAGAYTNDSVLIGVVADLLQPKQPLLTSVTID